MPSPSDLEKRFAASLLDAEGQLPDGLTSVSQPRPVERFNIYRNNVHVSLIEAMESKFPAVRTLVGDEFFRGLARTFIRQAPPRSALITHYGDGFAAYLSTFEHVQDVPYLPDVARLEWLRIEAYNAADAIPLGIDELSAIDHDRLGETCFELHPSLRLLRSKFPVMSIWQANIEGSDLSGINLDDGEDVMVIRPGLDVEILKLPCGACDFIEGLGSGINLEDANSAALEADGRFDLQLSLSGLMQAGAIVGVSI